MSEDNVNQNNNDADEVVTLKGKLEKIENEKVALEMKLRESDDNLYSEDYLNFIQEQKTKKRSQGTAFGGRIADYTEEQLQEMGTNIPQLIKIIAGEVYDKVRTEDDRKQTVDELNAQKKRIAKARIEIKEFAAIRPDFKELAPTIKDLSDEHTKLNLKQLYKLAGGKHPDGLKKEDPLKDERGRPKSPPNTRPTGEVGVKGSDSNLSIREVIRQEFDKL